MVKILQMYNVKKCIILERINKFVAKVVLDGKVQLSYVNNTGRLSKYLSRGHIGFCVFHEGKRKTRCRLFAIKEGSLAVLIDTGLQMKALEKAIALECIPWIKKCRILKSNVRLGASYIDYLLECGGRKAYLEVKSAVLRNGRYAMYPDCPSSRGRKHIRELIAHVRRGGLGIILFIAAMPRVEAFKPNNAADPEIGRLLFEAKKVGVSIRAIGMYYDPEKSSISLSKPDLPVEI